MTLTPFIHHVFSWLQGFHEGTAQGSTDAVSYAGIMGLMFVQRKLEYGQIPDHPACPNSQEVGPTYIYTFAQSG